MARVLVVDPDPRSRLAVLAALGRAHDVHALEPGADPLREVRRLAPDLVILGASPGPEAVQRLARAIRTDGGPARRVALVELPPHAVGPDVSCASWGLDGWLGQPEDAAAWVRALEVGPWPVRVGAHAPARGPGILRRLRRALL